MSMVQVKKAADKEVHPEILSMIHADHKEDVKTHNI